MKEIDARGLACPAPVLQTKAALDEGQLQGVSVLVLIQVRWPAGSYV